MERLKDITVSDSQPFPNLLGMDFVNTLSSRGSNQPRDRFKQYNDLITWGQQSGLINIEREQALIISAQQYPEMGKQVLERAIVLREAIYRLIKALKERTHPQQDDLNILNSELEIASRHLKLTFHQDQYDWEWEYPADALDQILWPITRSAAEILDSTMIQRIGICEDETCGWLFYDTSKNHSRRWCDMDDCGNRAKARRHYARKKVITDPN